MKRRPSLESSKSCNETHVWSRPVIAIAEEISAHMTSPGLTDTFPLVQVSQSHIPIKFKSLWNVYTIDVSMMSFDLSLTPVSKHRNRWQTSCAPHCITTIPWHVVNHRNGIPFSTYPSLITVFAINPLVKGSSDVFVCDSRLNVISGEWVQFES